MDLCITRMDRPGPTANIPSVTSDTHALPDELLASYRAARYRVFAPGRELQLRIDQHDEGLAKLLREAWVEGAALLTAWNPGSQPQPLERNRASQKQLVRELEAAGHPCLAGRNEAATGNEAWNEDSVLALDISLAAARALAARYGQLAFLWIDGQATPRLVITAAQA